MRHGDRMIVNPFELAFRCLHRGSQNLPLLLLRQVAVRTNGRSQVVIYFEEFDGFLVGLRIFAKHSCLNDDPVSMLTFLVCMRKGE